MYGMQAFASFSIGILVMPDATNRLMPIGGVTIPIARLQVMMIPKCTGSIPAAVAIGTMIGVKIMMFGITKSLHYRNAAEIYHKIIVSE